MRAALFVSQFSRATLPTAPTFTCSISTVRHIVLSLGSASGSPAGALKHLRYFTLDQHSPKRGREARQPSQRGMAGRCKQPRKDGLEHVSTAAEHGTRHACADAGGGQSTKVRAHPATECARVNCNVLAPLGSDEVDCQRLQELTGAMILTRSRPGRELAHRAEAADGGAGGCREGRSALPAAGCV